VPAVVLATAAGAPAGPRARRFRDLDRRSGASPARHLTRKAGGLQQVSPTPASARSSPPPPCPPAGLPAVTDLPLRILQIVDAAAFLLIGVLALRDWWRAVRDGAATWRSRWEAWAGRARAGIEPLVGHAATFASVLAVTSMVSAGALVLYRHSVLPLRGGRSCWRASPWRAPPRSVSWWGCRSPPAPGSRRLRIRSWRSTSSWWSGAWQWRSPRTGWPASPSTSPRCSAPGCARSPPGMAGS